MTVRAGALSFVLLAAAGGSLASAMPKKAPPAGAGSAAVGAWTLKTTETRAN